MIHDLRPGGAEQAFLDHIGRLRSLGSAMVLVRPGGALISRTDPDIPLYHLERGGTDPAPPHVRSALARVVPESGAGGWLGGAASLGRKAARLARIAERERASVVATFLHKSHAIGLLGATAPRSAFRVVVNVHEQPADHVETHFGPTRRRVVRALYRLGLPAADRVVAVSRGIADELVGTFAVPRGRIEVVPNPVDLDALQRRAAASSFTSALPAGVPIVLGLGRLERVKGFDVLVRAMHAVRDRTGALLVLAGDGSERGPLEELVRSLDFGERVRFTGHLAEPLPLLRSADVLAVPSYTEAWPTVVVEALALGTPVVATRCSPGVVELLDGGCAGRLVEPGSHNALANAILDLLDHPATARALAHAGRGRARRIADAPCRFERVLLESARRASS